MIIIINTRKYMHTMKLPIGLLNNNKKKLLK